MYSDDYEYANSRLTETIVRLGSEPVFVHTVGRAMLTQYSTLDNMADIKVCKAGDLDLHPVPLGYCNYNKQASYLTRIPMRRDWRQGLRRGNFTALNGVDAGRIPYESLRQCILGDYPTFAAACDAVKKIKSIAWHRHWAVSGDGQIWHKGAIHPVGVLEGDKIVLSSRYQYLKEALEESL